MSLRSILLFANAVVLVVFGIAWVLIYLPHDASAGQLMVDIILLPTVAFGFYLGIVELRKQREKPDLDVIWTRSDVIELEQSEHEKKVVRLDPLIVNRGNTSTIWFTVQLEVPKVLLIGSENIRFHAIVGNDGSGVWKTFESDVSYNFTLMSNGQIAMYPDYEMPSCYIDFTIFPNIEYPEECEITYTIISDKTKAIKGSCIVRIEPENLARKIEPEYLLEDILLKDIFPSKRRSHRTQR